MLGELALARLRSLDQVAYVRFASVYRQFRSVEDFIEELNTLKDTAALLSGPQSEKSRPAVLSGNQPGD
jgi:transcriptional regulator NrdR family protein